MVVEIREMASAGESYGSIAKEKGVTAEHIRKIVLRASWSNV
jgi:predicted transcriptional regulator